VLLAKRIKQHTDHDIIFLEDQLAFPGTYNISYYKGDTLEFKIFPKDASGAAFGLSEFENELGPNFTISTSRGEAGLADQVIAYAEIIDDYVLCVIRPEDGEQLDPATRYVYDIEIVREDTPYNIVYTLLTGNISVTDQVSGATVGES
jgi:hypothetical protein